MNLALYISFFGFSAAPFAKEIGDADLWLPPSKQDTVDTSIFQDRCGTKHYAMLM